ncbi:TPA: hypothetical protein ACX6RC_001988 [Photobacterium damselae]
MEKALGRVDSSGNESSFGFISFQIDREPTKLTKMNQIKHFLAQDYFEEGMITKTQLYLENLLSDNNLMFQESFRAVWLDLYKNNASQLELFINICSMMDYTKMGDSADALLLGASSHKSVNVQEAVIRAIEAWEQSDHKDYIENMRPFESEWIEEYRLEVLDYLREL